MRSLVRSAFLTALLMTSVATGCGDDEFGHGDGDSVHASHVALCNKFEPLPCFYGLYETIEFCVGLWDLFAERDIPSECGGMYARYQQCSVREGEAYCDDDYYYYGEGQPAIRLSGACQAEADALHECMYGPSGDSDADTDTDTDDGCDIGEILCDPLCVDPNTDENNCGQCGNRCEAYEECLDGFCTYS